MNLLIQKKIVQNLISSYLEIRTTLQDILCNCLAIEAMGQEVIESAKAVVVRKRQAQLALLEEEKEDKLERLEKQLLALGEKVDAILQHLK